jgi:hypothetical protein
MYLYNQVGFIQPMKNCNRTCNSDNEAMKKLKGRDTRENKVPTSK